MIFVRHGRALAQPDVPTHDWPLDPARTGDIRALRASLPELPIVCSDMRRAVETARLLGDPTVDTRLREIERPWTHDVEGAIARYLRDDALDGWEPQAAARERFAAVVAEHGRAVYVTHGTVLSLYLASAVPALDAANFWKHLENPDAWRLDETGLTRVGGSG